MFREVNNMHKFFGVTKAVSKMDKEQLAKLLEFRLSMLTEEYLETIDAHKAQDAEEVVDGLVDILVVAVGTLDLMGVDVRRAWNTVMNCNITKEPGVKPSRPNPLGLPDLIKPPGWVGPDHSENHGKLADIW